MDLSIAGNLDAIRRKLLSKATVPFGTVPIYQAAIEAEEKKGSLINMDEDDIFGVIEKHAKDGVDFMTIHCGVTKRIVDHITKEPRLMGIVSRGGSFLAAWIRENKKENPLYEHFDYLLGIVREYDVVLSLGDGLRPGCIFDASDFAQIEELHTIGKLIEKARKANVQVIVEGPGHLPLDQVRTNVKMAKSICDGAPFYVLGPVVTDIAAGYDHITAAIGGSIAALAGADFLCVVTPSEHLAFPLVEDVKRGLIAAKIAAHVADIVKLKGKALEWDLEIDSARAKLDWNRQFEKAIDPGLAKKIYYRKKPKAPKTCTLCGKYCAIKLSKASSS
jgi:phosphomethylpyrimidine synthase